MMMTEKDDIHGHVMQHSLITSRSLVAFVIGKRL